MPDLDASDDFHPQVSANRVGRAREGAQGHRFVVRIEQAVELGAACAHAPGQHRLGEMVLAHDGAELAGDDPLYGPGPDLLLKPPVLPENVGPPGHAALPFPSVSLIRPAATSRPTAGGLF